MARRLSAALIGPNTLFREGLKQALQLHSTQYIVKKISETADSVQETANLDLIILMGDEDEAALLGQVRRAKHGNSNARVVVMSDIECSEPILRLREAGADGCLLRAASSEAFLASLNVVMLGGTVVPPMRKDGPARQGNQSASVNQVAFLKLPDPIADPDHTRLSGRETEILLCLTKGESNKIIARKCDIAEATVKVHLKAILRKIRVSNRTQAAVWARNNRQALSTPSTTAGHVSPAGANGPRIPLDAAWRGKTQLSS